MKATKSTIRKGLTVRFSLGNTKRWQTFKTAKERDAAMANNRSHGFDCQIVEQSSLFAMSEVAVVPKKRNKISTAQANGHSEELDGKEVEITNVQNKRRVEGEYEFLHNCPDFKIYPHEGMYPVYRLSKNLWTVKVLSDQ